MSSITLEQEPSVSVACNQLTAVELTGGIFCHICLQTFSNKKEFDGHWVVHESVSSEISYTCVVCKRNIVGYPTFRDHCYKKHAVNTKHKCNHCRKTFPRQTELNKHIYAVHIFKCDKHKCVKYFASQKELAAHQFVHKTHQSIKPPYQCQTCSSQIDGIDVCEEHIDKHCSFSYSCPICNEALTNDNAIQHLTKHFGEVLKEDKVQESNAKTSNPSENTNNSSINTIGGILCHHCDVIHNNRLDFDRHFTEKHPDDDTVYSCTICKKQFVKYSKFGCHCYEHKWKNKFRCDQCEQSFSRLSLLVLHKEAYHAGPAEAEQARPINCPECSRTFCTDRHLRAHLRTAHGIEGVTCPEPGCDSTFQSPKDLILHTKLHNKGNDNWCRQCGLPFPTLASCEQHLDVHKKKLFTCPVCPKEYGEKHWVMKHLTQHFKAVLHMCKVCGKIFTAKNRVVEHVKTHSSAKTYECKFCGKGFVKANHLEQHMAMHINVKPYKCVACPKTFGSDPNWRKHMRKIHNIDPKTVKKPFSTNYLINQTLNDSTSKDNADNKIKSELLHEFGDTDDSTMESDSIEPIILQKESHIYETQMKMQLAMTSVR